VCVRVRELLDLLASGWSAGSSHGWASRSVSCACDGWRSPHLPCWRSAVHVPAGTCR